MQFGIFDQNDRGPYPLGEQYENRLKLIEFSPPLVARMIGMETDVPAPPVTARSCKALPLLWAVVTTRMAGLLVTLPPALLTRTA